MNTLLRRAAWGAGLWLLAAALTPLPVCAEEPAPLLPITFQVNDADEKDKVLPGVAIGGARTPTGPYEWSGTTDAAGQLKVSVAAGSWYVTYRLKDYIAIERTETVIRETNQLVTTTLSISIEAGGVGDQRRIRIILNWGSRTDQVRDADSHLTCACGMANAHVSYQNRRHTQPEHSVDLDVDDTDWGGPETITLLNPPPGSYAYFVHDYSGPPATLADAEVVVRVLFGDTVAGEFRVPPNARARAWWPFKAIVVDALLEPRIVPFTKEELSAGQDVGSVQGDFQRSEPPSGGGHVGRWVFWFIVIWVVFRILKRKRR